MNTLEREAFIEAYLNSVGYAPKEYVEGYLDKLKSGAKQEYDEYYSSVQDALLMWNSALYFANQQQVTA